MMWPDIAMDDRLYWCGNKNDIFSVKNYFTINFQLLHEDQGLWSSMWRFELHERLKLFLWRILSNALSIKQVLNRKIVLDDMSCVVCGEGTESLLHLFKDWSGFRAFAFACCWGGRSDAWLVSSIPELIKAFLNPPAQACDGEYGKNQHHYYHGFPSVLFLGASQLLHV